MLDPERHVLNPEVLRIWSARTLPGSVPKNNKEMLDKVEICRNIISMRIDTRSAVYVAVSRWFLLYFISM